MAQAHKGAAVDGPAFLNVIVLFNRGWRIPTEDGLKAAELEDLLLATVRSGKWKIDVELSSQAKTSRRRVAQD
jgi:hypothetical protein